MFLYRRYYSADDGAVDAVPKDDEEIEFNDKSSGWLRVPNPLSYASALKSFYEGHKKSKEKGNGDLVSTVLPVLKHSQKVFKVLCYLGAGVNEALLLTVKNGFVLVERVTRPSCGEDCKLEDCACKSSPSAFMFRFVNKNKLHILTFFEETVPAIHDFYQRHAVHIQYSIDCARLVIGSASQIMKKVVRIAFGQCCLHAFDVVYAFQKLSRFALILSRGFYNVFCDPEVRTFFLENQHSIRTVLLTLVKSSWKISVRLVPVLYRLLKTNYRIICFSCRKLNEFLSEILDESPELRNILYSACTEVANSMFLLTNSFVSAVISPSPNELDSLSKHTVFQDVIKYGTPVAGMIATTGSACFFKTFLTLIRLTFRMMREISPVTCVALTHVRDSLPFWRTVTVQAIYHSKVASTYFVAGGVAAASALANFAPIVVKDTSTVGICVLTVAKSVSVGIVCALSDVTPIAKDDLTVYLPLIKNGSSVVIADTYYALKLVSPALLSSTQELRIAIVTCVQEVFPVLLEAAVVIQPDVVSALQEITRASFQACKTVSSDLTRASLVVGPTLVSTIRIVAPTLNSAVIEVSPAVVAASKEIGTTFFVSLLEVRRAYLIAATRLIQALSRGVTTVISDVSDALCVILSGTEASLDEVNSALLAACDATSGVVLTSVRELSTTVRILSHLVSSGPSAGPESPSSSTLHSKHGNFTGSRLTDTFRQQSSNMLELSTKAALCSKIIVCKGNEIALSLMYDANVQIMKCYEKVEPFMFRFCLKCYAELSVILSSHKAIRAVSISAQVLLGSCLVFPLAGYLCKDAVIRAASEIKENSDLIKSTSRMITYRMLYFVRSVFTSVMDIECSLGPIIWTVLRRVSPEVWKLISRVTPVVWLSYCAICRETWSALVHFAPPIYGIFRSRCVSSWKFLMTVIPELREVVLAVSPKVWTVVCRASSMSWSFLCRESPACWKVVCNVSPVVWRNFCCVVSSIWTAFCDVSCLSWDSLTLIAHLAYAAQRRMSSSAWYALCASCSVAWSQVKVSKFLLNSATNVSETVFASIFATTILFVASCKSSLADVQILCDTDEFDCGLLDTLLSSNQKESLTDESRTILILRFILNMIGCKKIMSDALEFTVAKAKSALTDWSVRSIKGSLNSKSKQISRLVLFNECSKTILNGKEMSSSLYVC